MKTINVGLIGFGTIGSGVVKVFQEKAAMLSQKLGIVLHLKLICDQNLTAPRNVAVVPAMLTTEVNDILHNPEISIVIELIGGIHPAKEFILEALRHKKFVVTANKALLAEDGEEIFKVARENGVDVYFEGSVGGGIPIIKVLREGLIANEVEDIFGIINGTSNYILTQMSQEGCDFKTALREAQKKGYAEKDPILDINGIDSAHKIAILAQVCFDQRVSFSDVYVEGIQEVSLHDIRYADELGYTIKLLAIAKRRSRDVQIRVHPTLLPKDHILSKINGVFNAIFIRADLIGETLLHGKGAGQLPTASAVVSDVVSIAKKIVAPDTGSVPTFAGRDGGRRICSIEEIETRYYIRFMALDEPAVLSKISTILGELNISIHSVIQKGRRQAQAVPIVMMTHEAKEQNVREALRAIGALPVVKNKPVAIRVERL
jgi:homoserine dehydrogenase